MNPAAAAIAAAIVIPSLLALYFLKLKRRQIEVSSTFLWKKAIQDLQVNAPFQRLRRNLLLLLQLLILLALILALAQPVMKRNKTMGKMSVILIDRSASMSSVDGKGDQSRLEEAKEKAKAVVSSLPKDAMAMVMAFDEGAEVVQSFTSDPVLLRSAIDGIKPTQLGTKLRTALSLVEARSLAFISDQLRPNETGSDLWVFSDGKIEDLDRVALKSASLKEYVSVGSAQSTNVGIVALSAKRNIERPTEVQVFVRLENYGPKVVEATAQLSIDGRIPTGGVRRNIRLAPSGWTDDQRIEAEKTDKDLSTGGVEFNVEITKGAVLKVEIKDVEGDVFIHNDAAQIVAPPPKTMGVVLVGNKENPALEKYLEADFTLKSGKISGEEYEAEIKKDNGADLMKKYDVMIFDRFQPSKLPPAGSFMYFATVPPDTGLKYALADDGLQVVNDKETAMDWNREHPLMKNINTMRLFCQLTYKLKTPLEAETIIEGARGRCWCCTGRVATRILWFRLTCWTATGRSIEAIRPSWSTACNTWRWGRTWTSASRTRRGRPSRFRAMPSPGSKKSNSTARRVLTRWTCPLATAAISRCPRSTRSGSTPSRRKYPPMNASRSTC